ncbi:response regulator [Neptunomonas qingdaonensis]|uniref:Transcriptional regulatory protein n=1 Tax=Neptunomonas qingdaonensis TaxID=1045558 RepID=A0A1I2LPR1_9GAMM|nr:response regulator [Neptunomonas qingdaonensis]SFF81245.1 two-component system, CitB family, response regulator [Neptunomonas qingdaonensis]
MNLIRIVIAEDDQQIAEIQKRFLERIEGFELVGIAHSLEDAEDLVDVMQPELLLLDIHFPTGTGLDLLRKLRARNSSVDVILVTAAKEVDSLREALHGGVFDYILKPLVFERLQETLDRYHQHLGKFQAMQTLGQRDVDTILPYSTTATSNDGLETRLPKGVDALTLEKVRSVFSTHSHALNAEEVGEYIGASRTTARRYLEFLVSNNELSAEVSYGSVGRPERKYKNI